MYYKVLVNGLCRREFLYEADAKRCQAKYATAGVMARVWPVSR